MVGLERHNRCLVLGGTGFIGSYVVQRLAKEGVQVTVLVQPGSDLGRIRDVIKSIRLFNGDFTDPETVRQALRGQDSVVHLMGATVPRSSMLDPIFDLQTSIIPAMHLLQEACDAGVKKIVFASSGGTVYGVSENTPIAESHPTEPLNVYGISKLTIEKMLKLWNKLHGMSNIVLRLSNVYGEGQARHGDFGAIAIFLDKFFKGEEISIWGDGSVVRDYVHADDVADAFLRALCLGTKGEETAVFNIGSGVGVSLNDLIGIMRKITTQDVAVRYADGRPIDVPINTLDISLAEHVLGYRPSIMVEEGIRRLWEHMRKESCS